MHKIISENKKNQEIGGKAKNLILLDRAGLCPNFIVIDQNFANKICFDKKLDKSSFHKIKETLKQLKIKNPIVRSSFTHEDNKNFSFAGLFESYRCSIAELPKYIRKVWESKFNRSVKHYQQKFNLIAGGMALIIQEYVKSDIGGVCFLSTHEEKQRYNLIEYAERPEDVVLGRVKPKILLNYKGYNIANNSNIKVNEQEIPNLLKSIESVRGIKELADSDLDIEFLISKGRAYLLQTRLITKKISLRQDFIFQDLGNKYLNVTDVSEHKLNVLFKKIGLETAFVKIKKEKEKILINPSSFFNLIDAIENFSLNKKKVLRFIDLIKKYHNYMMNKSKKAKTIKEIIIDMKNYYLNLYFYDAVINCTIQILGYNLKNRYNLSYEECEKYFVPLNLSISSENLLRLLNGQNKCRDNPLYRNQFLERADPKKIIELKKRLQQLKKREKYSKQLNDMEYNLRNLIWLHDANDYYIDIVSYNYNSRFNQLLKIKNINLENNELNLAYKIPFKDFDNFNFTELPKIINKFKSNKNKNKITNKSFPLSGFTIVSKNFTGKTRVIKKSKDIINISKNDIIVAKNTYPSYTEAMCLAKGIISERGGLTSHAAIVSRELNIPCLVGVEGCLDLIKTGDRLRISNGKIYKLS